MKHNLALARTNGHKISTISPRPSDSAKMSLMELKELAEIYFASGAFPDLKNANQAIVKIKAGEDLGFSPHVALAGIHFFQGRAVIGANLLASLIKDSGKYEYKVLEHTNKKCSIQMFQLMNGEWLKMGIPVTYTIEDAQMAGLTSKDAWKKFPADMLFAAVIRQACRRYCADVLRGTPTFDHYSAEESTIDAAGINEFDQSANVVDQEAITEEELGEPVTDAQIERIEQGEIDSGRIDLETAINDLITDLTGGETIAVNEILRGRQIDKMDKAALETLYDELMSM